MDFTAQRQALGRKIAEERKRQNLTQAKLALMSNINEGYLCEVEKGIANVSISKLLSIAQSLEIEASDLLKGI